MKERIFVTLTVFAGVDGIQCFAMEMSSETQNWLKIYMFVCLIFSVSIALSLGTYISVLCVPRIGTWVILLPDDHFFFFLGLHRDLSIKRLRWFRSDVSRSKS